MVWRRAWASGENHSGPSGRSLVVSGHCGEDTAMLLLLVPAHHHRSDPQRQCAPLRARPTQQCLLLACTAKTKKKCHHCGGPQPEWNKEGVTISGKWSESAEFESEEEKKYAKDTPITVGLARDLLSFFSDEDCAFLGLRPKLQGQVDDSHSVVGASSSDSPDDGSERRLQMQGHDDLTTLIRDIVKSNNKIKAALGRKRNPVRRMWSNSRFIWRLTLTKMEVPRLESLLSGAPVWPATREKTLRAVAPFSLWGNVLRGSGGVSVETLRESASTLPAAVSSRQNLTWTYGSSPSQSMWLEHRLCRSRSLHSTETFCASACSAETILRVTALTR